MRVLEEKRTRGKRRRIWHEDLEETRLAVESPTMFWSTSLLPPFSVFSSPSPSVTSPTTDNLYTRFTWTLQDRRLFESPPLKPSKRKPRSNSATSVQSKLLAQIFDSAPCSTLSLSLLLSTPLYSTRTLFHPPSSFITALNNASPFIPHRRNYRLFNSRFSPSRPITFSTPSNRKIWTSPRTLQTLQQTRRLFLRFDFSLCETGRRGLVRQDWRCSQWSSNGFETRNATSRSTCSR